MRRSTYMRVYTKALHTVIVIVYSIKIRVWTSISQIFLNNFKAIFSIHLKFFVTGRVSNFKKLQNTKLLNTIYGSFLSPFSWIDVITFDVTNFSHNNVWLHLYT